MLEKLILRALCALALTLPLWAGKEFIAQPGEQTRAVELIIRLTRGANPASVVASVAPGSQIISHPASDTHLVKVTNRPLANASSDFARNPFVEFVEPNRIRHSTGGLPALNDPSSSLQWALTTVRAALAWNIIPNRYLTAGTAGSGRIRVAVLDTGGDCTHNDFKNSGGTSVDSAQGGQISMALSQAPVATTIASPACPWQDDHGHGTHTMGIVAAATQNALGVASLGYPMELVSYKILDSTGSGDDFTISQAIRLATDAGIHIISMSLGGAGYSQTFQDAINYAWQHNTLVIAAAGNSNSSALFFPAGANYAIGVAATDSSNNKASFSNFGPSVDIAAPGVSIYSTVPSYANPIGVQNYAYLSGTSMATPFVSALAGLIALTTPNFSTAAVAQRIQQSAASSIAGGGWDQNLGYGVIDAFQAISGTLRPATLGSIVGQVTTSAGVPITGATVIAAGQSRTTGGDGLYRIQNVAAGSYTLTASASGFAAQNPTVVVTPGADANVTVALGVATGAFTGTVTTGGAAVSGAVVQALSAGLIKATAFSASNGLYVLSVPAGTYDIQVAGVSRITSKALSKTVAAGGSTIVDLALPKMGVIAGTVRDGNSNPLANAQLSFSQTGFSAGAVTDSSGNYASIGLPSGAYTLTASAVGFPDAIVNNVAVSADTVTTVNPQLGAAVAVTLTPPSVSLTANQTSQFTATVTGTSNTAVTWSINPVVGSISSGLYTAPASITVAQVITVTATSVADGNKSASSVVNLAPPGGWYTFGGTWTNRKAITIDHTKVSGGSSLSNFPMLFSVTDANLKTGNGGGVGQANGNDILFTRSDGVTKLNHQLESYSAGTGQVIAWVQVPSLSTTADTVIYVYYGNATAAKQENPAGVWDSNYVGVWHLNESAGPAADSTANVKNAAVWSGSPAFGGTGQIGNSVGFNGVADSLKASSVGLGGATAATWSGWINWGDFTNPTYIANLGGFGTFSIQGYNGGGYTNWTPAIVVELNVNNRNMKYAPAPSLNAWHHVALVMDIRQAAGNEMTLYIDRIPQTLSAYQSFNGDNSGAFTAQDLYFAGQAAPWYYGNGKLNEVRLSSTARSAAWIATEYNNQNSPSTFYTVGGQQSGGSGVTVTVTSAPAGLSLNVDGSDCTAPCTLQWNPGSNHTIGVTTTPQGGTIGTRYVFASWSDGGAQSHSITAPSSNATYTASFSTQYTLTTTASPTAGGIISPVSGWYGSGAVVAVSATANSGYQFSGFAGALSGTTTPQNLVMNGPATVTANFGVVGGTSWYNSAWTNRKAITIDHTKVSAGSSLSSFPMLFSVTDANLKTVGNGGGVGQANGNDILFTGPDGVTKLNHQLEFYNPITGQVIAWVQLPSSPPLSTTADTVIYVYYGNTTAANQQNRAGVWDSNYVGVWHLNESAGPAADSTVNAKNAAVWTGNPAFGVAGQIGNSVGFNGVGDSLKASSVGLGGATAATWSGWINWGDFTNDTMIANLGGYGTFSIEGYNGGGYTNWSPAIVVQLNVNNRNMKYAPAPSLNAWHHIALVMDISQAAGNEMALYIDRIPQTLSAYQSFNGDNSGAFTAQDLYFAGQAAPWYYGNGKLNEVRLSSTARSAAWIATEYNNQNSPSTFYTVGVQQNVGGAAAKR